jgi:hypothetical protein
MAIRATASHLILALGLYSSKNFMAQKGRCLHIINIKFTKSRHHTLMAKAQGTIEPYFPRKSSESLGMPYPTASIRHEVQPELI